MKNINAIIFAFTFALCGCQQKSNSEPPITSSKPEAPTPAIPVPTAEDWNKALNSSYVETSFKDKGDGVSSFAACFEKVEKRCNAFAFGSRDAFRKLRFFTGRYSQSPLFGLWPYVGSYVSLSDNSRPDIFLAPLFYSKGGWLFMEKVSILLDNNVIFERDFSKEKVERNNDYHGVTESYDFIATESEIANLRKITADSKLLIRLTGQKGYFSISADNSKNFRDEIINTLNIFDFLNKSLDGHIPPTSKS